MNEPLDPHIVNSLTQLVETSPYGEMDRAVEQLAHFVPLELRDEAAQLLTQYRQAAERVKADHVERAAQGVTDGLTGVFNRRGYNDLADQWVTNIASLYAKSNQKLTGGLVVVDLNNFRDVNNTYGHQFGDAVLQTVAQTLQASTRSYDTALRMRTWEGVARTGGDEFVVLMEGVPVIGAKEVVANLQSRVNEGIGNQLYETQRDAYLQKPELFRELTSMGVALYGPDGKDLNTLYRVADEHQYAAKGKLKNSRSRN